MCGEGGRAGSVHQQQRGALSIPPASHWTHALTSKNAVHCVPPSLTPLIITYTTPSIRFNHALAQGYIRRGDPKKWIIFNQGGGWCSSDVSCAQRSETALGSSKGWGPTYTDTYEGSELFATPPFDTYTVVFAMCALT